MTATRHADVAIAGGGLAGSLAAAMLSRAGIDAVLIDPHPVYPPDFRCEKLDGAQVRALRLTGVADAVLRASTPDRECWVARCGHLVEKRPGDQRGIMYDALVNTLRAQIPAGAAVIAAKVADLVAGAERQVVRLSNGDEISARLVVLATGLNLGLRHKLGLGRDVISAGHSISAGFNVTPVERAAFRFSSLTYFAERPSDRMAYLTLFPIGASLRANLFGYRGLDDPWLKQLRDAPRQTLQALWPGLRRVMGDFAVADTIKIRPVDLYVSHGTRRPGVVLVGDAFATSCPAAGTGARKVLVDVERLCNIHIPRWLATPGMGTDKIAAFYDDPIKQACDRFSLAKAYDLRSFSIDASPRWAAWRGAKFVLHGAKGALRALSAGLFEIESPRSFPRKRGPSVFGKDWVPASAGTNGVCLNVEQRSRPAPVASGELLLDGEADHRPMIEPVGVLRGGQARAE
jgi:2-polyprenyl-6-methoxyphenol hydroxylase-like FAD-dependent oxidoreductase